MGKNSIGSFKYSFPNSTKKKQHNFACHADKRFYDSWKLEAPGWVIHTVIETHQKDKIARTAMIQNYKLDKNSVPIPQYSQPNSPVVDTPATTEAEPSSNSVPDASLGEEMQVEEQQPSENQNQEGQSQAALLSNNSSAFELPANTAEIVAALMPNTSEMASTNEQYFNFNNFAEIIGNGLQQMYLRNIYFDPVVQIQNAVISAQYETITSQNATIVNLSQQIEQLHSEKAELENKVESLQLQIDQTQRNEITTLQRKVDELQAELCTSQKKNEIYNNRIEKLTKMVETQQKTIESMKEKEKEEKSNFKELRKELIEYNIKFNRLDGNCIKLDFLDSQKKAVGKLKKESTKNGICTFFLEKIEETTLCNPKFDMPLVEFLSRGLKHKQDETFELFENLMLKPREGSDKALSEKFSKKYFIQLPSKFDQTHFWDSADLTNEQLTLLHGMLPKFLFGEDTLTDYKGEIDYVLKKTFGHKLFPCDRAWGKIKAFDDKSMEIEKETEQNSATQLQNPPQHEASSSESQTSPETETATETPTKRKRGRPRKNTTPQKTTPKKATEKEPPRYVVTEENGKRKDPPTQVPVTEQPPSKKRAVQSITKSKSSPLDTTSSTTDDSNNSQQATQITPNPPANSSQTAQPTTTAAATTTTNMERNFQEYISGNAVGMFLDMTKIIDFWVENQILPNGKNQRVFKFSFDSKTIPGLGDWEVFTISLVVQDPAADKNEELNQSPKNHVIVGIFKNLHENYDCMKPIMNIFNQQIKTCFEKKYDIHVCADMKAMRSLFPESDRKCIFCGKKCSEFHQPGTYSDCRAFFAHFQQEKCLLNNVPIQNFHICVLHTMERLTENVITKITKIYNVPQVVQHAVNYFRSRGVPVRFVKATSKDEMDDETTHEIKKEKLGMLTGESCKLLWEKENLLEDYVDVVVNEGRKSILQFHDNKNDKTLANQLITEATPIEYKRMIRIVRNTLKFIQRTEIPEYDAADPEKLLKFQQFEQELNQMKTDLKSVSDTFYDWYRFAPDYFHFIIFHSDLFFAKNSIPLYYFQNQGVEHVLHCIADDVKFHKCPAHSLDDMLSHAMFKRLRAFTMRLGEEKFVKIFPELEKNSCKRKDVLTSLQAKALDTSKPNAAPQTTQQKVPEIIQESTSASQMLA